MKMIYGWTSTDIIIKIRGQIENRPLENTRFAGRKWLLAYINGPAADWFSVHHPMNINQSGYVYWRGKTIQVRTACVVNVCRLEKRKTPREQLSGE